MLAGAAVLVAAVIVAVVLLGGSGADYTVHARFLNAAQLVHGDSVEVAGRPIGSVNDINVTPDGQADVTLHITESGYTPLREGTTATVRQASLSGVANRYVQLDLPGTTPGQGRIPNGGTIPASDTTTAVDLDELFNTFDTRTRNALRDVIRGYATSYGGRGAQTNAGWLYLNPALASTSRLFSELNYDTPVLRSFVKSSASLVTDVAAKADDLAGLVDHLATTTGAIGDQKTALESAIHQLPGFMRRANTTFVNLRAALDDLRPLVRESKPVAKELQPFLAELQPLARNARPTIHELANLVYKPGTQNDLIDLTKSTVPVSKIANGPVQANGKQRPGAFPASLDALKSAIPELTYARPYAVDLTGWFDDFGHSGIYDALGGASRAALNINLFTNLNSGGTLSTLQPLLGGQSAAYQNATVATGQRNRCPGAGDHGTIFVPPGSTCDPSEVLPGS